MIKDFSKIQFQRSLRGYAPDEVDTYIQYVNNEFQKLERHSSDSDRKLMFALRKLESLTSEIQKISALSDIGGVIVQDPDSDEVPANGIESEKRALEEARAELRKNLKELEESRAEINRVKADAEKTRKDADEKALALLNAARARGEKIILDAQIKADSIIAESAKKSRAAAEQIITDAALASRKIIRDAEEKADSACRDVMNIYKAAEDMYKEVSSFRGNLFSLYNVHIQSIESITGSAHGLIDSVDDIVRDLEGDWDGEDEQADKPTETAPAHEEAQNPSPTAETIPQNKTELFFDAGVDSTVVEDDNEEAKEEEEEEAEEENYTPLSDLYINIGDEDGEYYDSFDEIPDNDTDDESYPDTTDTDDGTLPWDEEKSDTDDFSVSEDDIPTGTGMLDIVKKVSGTKDSRKNDDYYDLDELISSAHISSDEFDRVFNTKNSSSNVDEIMRQPLVSPEAPENPKKHSKF